MKQIMNANSITPFISFIKNPNDEEDGLMLIDEGVLIELPAKVKNDLIEYLKEFLKKQK